MNKKVLLIAILFSITGLSALSAQTVLIAKEDTSYKTALLEVLVEKLEAEGLDIEMIDHKEELAGVDPADWGVVYVLNSGAQAMVRPWVTDWLDTVSGNDSNVIVHTTKRNEWDEALDVDALSSASKKRNIDEVTDDIVSRVKAKL